MNPSTPAAAASSSSSSTAYIPVGNGEGPPVEELRRKVAKKTVQEPAHGPLSHSESTLQLHQECEDTGHETPVPGLPSPDVLSAKKHLAVMHAQREEWDQVLAICTEQLCTFPEDSELLELKKDALKKRGAGHEAAERWEAAVADYLALATQFPPDAGTLKSLAHCFSVGSDWLNAIRCYKTLLEMDPKNLEYWRAVGYCCLKRREAQQPFAEGEAELALDVCTRLTQSDSRDPRVWWLGLQCVTHLCQRQQESNGAGNPSPTP